MGKKQFYYGNADIFLKYMDIKTLKQTNITEAKFLIFHSVPETRKLGAGDLCGIGRMCLQSDRHRTYAFHR